MADADVVANLIRSALHRIPATDHLEARKELRTALAALEARQSAGAEHPDDKWSMDYGGGPAAPADAGGERMPIDEALRYAALWRAGKMVGGDEDAVRDALLAEIEHLRAASRGAPTPESGDSGT